MSTNNSINTTEIGQPFAIYQPSGSADINTNTFTDFGLLVTYLNNRNPFGEVIVYFDQTFDSTLPIPAATYNFPPNVSFVVLGAQAKPTFAANTTLAFPNGIGTLNLTNIILATGNSTTSPLITIANQTIQPVINLAQAQINASILGTTVGTIFITDGAVPTVNLSESSSLNGVDLINAIYFDSSSSGIVVNVYDISQIAPLGIDSVTSTNIAIFADAAAQIDSSYSAFTTIASTVSASLLISSGSIQTSPVDSLTATGGFVTSLTSGTTVQNTVGYDLLVNISVVVTAAAGASLFLGVGPSSPPFTNAVTAALTVATSTNFSFSAIVPNNYYLLVTSFGGSITIGSIKTQSCAI